ncbi:MAG TPA: S46 family peptidase [Caulobacteraceae bacterium]|nr:S46 family peptidase [Caulobacteraceae bacterium]
MWRLAAALVLAWTLALAGRARAEEGLFTFDDAPMARIRADLGVAVDRAWLDRLQAASVRLSSGCSGSVVSGKGLVLTNQHCVLACEQALASAQDDVISQGFGVGGERQERACPGLSAEVLEAIVDVTADILGSGAGKTGEAFVAARQQALADAEARVCVGASRARCQVFSFFGGSLFQVYRYRRWDDVRLVFAPEAAVAFFGGQKDNFSFPRYALDFAFLRLYQGGRPAPTPAHLDWSNAAPTPGEAVFAAGNPGESERDLTTAELASLKDVILPLAVADWTDLRRPLVRLSRSGEAQRRETEAALFEADNEIKRLQGERQALASSALAAARDKEESDLKAALAAHPALALQIGDPWSALRLVQLRVRGAYPVWRELEEAAGGGSDLFDWARVLVRAAEERAKPSDERLPEFADANLPLIEHQLMEARPVDPALEQARLQTWLSELRQRLGDDTPGLRPFLRGEDPSTRAAALVAGSKLADPAVRAALWAGGAAAIAASADPMIAFVRATDPLSRAARTLWEEDIVGPSERDQALIDRARTMLAAPFAYPDASFSLRLSYGRVPAAADPAEPRGPFTTLADLIARAGAGGDEALPAAWAAAPKLDRSAVLDFVTTNDIEAGSSGSPVVDARERLIGAVFDGNAASLGGAFAYDGAHNRAIAVATAAIGEALANVYGRADLMAEIEGAAASADVTKTAVRVSAAPS